MIDPKALGAEQRELWRELGMDTVTPSGDQTLSQTRRTQRGVPPCLCA